jgi:hypothetical protein
MITDLKDDTNKMINEAQKDSGSFVSEMWQRHTDSEKK